MAVLTTATPHHLYFVWKLAEVIPLAAIWLERYRLVPPFETHHPFEARRDAYEREVLLAGAPAGFSEVALTHEVEDVNDPASVTALQALSADVVLVFGTGRLRPPVIDSARWSLNLHGGSPEHYRGLDSHLWTIYHRDFEQLVVTLHRVMPALDTGDIVRQKALKLYKDAGLHELRALTTKMCVDLCADAMLELQASGTLRARPQIRRGRYYSFMPAVLKEQCREYFEKHTAQL